MDATVFKSSNCNDAEQKCDRCGPLAGSQFFRGGGNDILRCFLHSLECIPIEMNQLGREQSSVKTWSLSKSTSPLKFYRILLLSLIAYGGISLQNFAIIQLRHVPLSTVFPDYAYHVRLSPSAINRSFSTNTYASLFHSAYIVQTRCHTAFTRVLVALRRISELVKARPASFKYPSRRMGIYEASIGEVASAPQKLRQREVFLENFLRSPIEQDS